MIQIKDAIFNENDVIKVGTDRDEYVGYVKGKSTDILIKLLSFGRGYDFMLSSTKSFNGEIIFIKESEVRMLQLLEVAEK